MISNGKAITLLSVDCSCLTIQTYYAVRVSMAWTLHLAVAFLIKTTGEPVLTGVYHAEIHETLFYEKFPLEKRETAVKVAVYP